MGPQIHLSGPTPFKVTRCLALPFSEVVELED